MSNENNNGTAYENGLTTAQGAKGPKVVKHLDVRIQEAREDVTKAQARLDKLLTEKANESRYESIEEGKIFTFNYGRGEKAGIRHGMVMISEKGKGAANKVRFSLGLGFEAEILDVRADAIVFPTAD